MRVHDVTLEVHPGFRVLHLEVDADPQQLPKEETRVKPFPGGRAKRQAETSSTWKTLAGKERSENHKPDSTTAILRRQNVLWLGPVAYIPSFEGPP